MKFDLSKKNLNLLVALDVLLREKHVTRAGQRLHLTQSAMSNILKQLRHTFKDELFIRGQAGRMLPTAYALTLVEPIAEILEKAQSIFQAKLDFDPTVTKATFTLGLSDYAEFVFLPLLVKYITKHAPHIDLVIKNINFLKNDYIFDHDEIDLAIGIFSKIPEKLVAQKLYKEESVIVGWQKNPLLEKKITLKQYAQAEQIVILYHEKREELFSEQLIQKMGRKRKVVMTVPNSLVALHSVVRTNLICPVLKKIAYRMAEDLPLAIQPVPFVYPPIYVNMLWHPKNRNNGAHHWLRKTILKIASYIDSSCDSKQFEKNI